jgi:hypothetical protein
MLTETHRLQKRPIQVKGKNLLVRPPLSFVQKHPVKIVIPVFDEVPSLWPGASHIIKQYQVITDSNFALKMPIDNPPVLSFNICVSFQEEDGTVVRYKLWENIGEVIPHVELYSGQILLKNTKIELWTIKSGSKHCHVYPELEEILLLTTTRAVIDSSPCGFNAATNSPDFTLQLIECDNLSIDLPFDGTDPEPLPFSHCATTFMTL